ncbi:MAG: hypothetical protein LC713_00555 [Actinobacteria bacterium]|nr:hypothetical protein [Actinomycetota bacterium]
MAPLPAGQPGFHLPGDGPGPRTPPRRRLSPRTRSLLFAALAGLLALRLARDAGVVGDVAKAAIPPLARAGLATVALFAVGGLGLTRLLLPAGLREHEALWVLPVGACAVALAMTVLGFAHVPFHVSLGLTLAGGVAVAVLALRRVPGAPGGLRGAGWPAYLALLLVAVALIPLFRTGFVTVEGQGQDAHLAVGTAQFLQHHAPTDVAPAEPVDRVPLVWRSKQPIYYALAAAASLSGLEPYRTISTVAAILLGLAALGFFLIARELLGAPRWAALCALGLVGLDRMVLHTVMHPYFNQTWGFFAMPFAIVLAWWALRARRTRGGVVLLAMFLAICAFAYPLAVPIPLLALGVFLWPERRDLSPRRLYRGRRSLLWIVPLVVLFVIPVLGVIEKQVSAYNVVFNPTRPLRGWGGDLLGYFREPQFLGVNTWPELLLTAPLLVYGTWRALRAAPRRVALGIGALLAFAAAFAVYFRLRDHGYYFHFKVLAFIGPVALTAAAAGLGRARRGAWALALLLVLALGAADREIGGTFDELPRYVLALRSVDAALAPGRSVRLDVPPQEQNWVAYMLHGQPLCSQHPLLHTSYPHVPVSRKADYILSKRGAAVPADAAGPPVRRLDAFLLYRESPAVRGRANCSQRMVQTVTSIPTG